MILWVHHHVDAHQCDCRPFYRRVIVSVTQLKFILGLIKILFKEFNNVTCVDNL